MFWRVTADRDADPAGWPGCRVIATFTSTGPVQILLVEAAKGAMRAVERGSAAHSVSPAEDEIYIDSATRTTWIVTGGGTRVSLLGYLPP